jgi:transposase
MGKCFRSADVNQALLLPPCLHDWLPEKHLARFLVDVVDALDLGAIYNSYEEKDGLGQAAYDPAMMVLVLLYAYCSGSYGSRKIQAKRYEDVAFRYLAVDELPDPSTPAEFRQRGLSSAALITSPGCSPASAATPFRRFRVISAPALCPSFTITPPIISAHNLPRS